MYITQCGKDLIKTREDLTVDTSTGEIMYKFTQEESLALVPKRPLEVTVYLMINGDRKEVRPIGKMWSQHVRTR